MMYLKHLLFVFVFLTNINIYAQTPIRFIHSYGNFIYNYGMSVLQEADTGYVILANVSGNLGNNNILLFKIDKNGDYVWDKLYADSSIFWGENVRKTPDNGFLITGYTNKTDSSGYDFVVIKTDSIGNKEWERYYGGTDWDFGKDAIIANDGNYLICGSTYSFGAGHSDMYLLKINTLGDTLWTKTFGGEYEDAATCVEVCMNGDIMIAGYTKSYGAGNYDALLVRYNSEGSYLWHQTYGGAEVEKIYGVRERYDKTIIMGGHTSSFGNGGDEFYLVFIDSAGNQQWYERNGGWDDERGYSLDLTLDNGYVLSGLTTGPGYFNVYFFKTYSDGSWHYTTSHGSAGEEYANCIKQATDGGYIIVGSSTGFGGCLSNILVIKTGEDGLSEPYDGVEEQALRKKEVLTIYPNPFSTNTFVELPFEINTTSIFKLYNSLGDIVFNKELKPNTKSFNLSRNNLPDGIYYYQWMEDYSVKGSGKIIICK